jgi:hypothetical protein
MANPIAQFIPQGHQHLVGLAAVLACATGGVLWLTGVRTARPLAAVALGVAGGIAGGLHAGAAQMSPLAGTVSGAITGVAVALLVFRFAQALLIGAAAGAIAGAVYYGTQFAPPWAIVHKTPSSWHAVWTVGQSAYAALPEQARLNLSVTTFGAAILAFVLAFAFPKPATVLGSAGVGVALMMAAVGLLTALYGTPQDLPQPPAAHAIMAGVLLLVGVLVQWRIAAGRADKPSQTPRQAAPAVCPA